MRLKYPNVGSNRGLIFEERFTDPLHVAHNGGTVNLVGAATLPLDHGATFPTIASGLTAYLTYPSTTARISMCSAMTVVFDITVNEYRTDANPRLMQGYEDASNNWAIGIGGVTTQGRVGFYVTRRGTLYQALATPQMGLTRSQIACVFTGAAIAVYQVGAAVATTASGYGPTADAGFRIGSASQAVRSTVLHHLRIWNRALSAADVAALYAGRDPIL